MSERPDDRIGCSDAQVITVGRHRIRVQTSGHGPPLLLVMGIGGNLEMWEPLRRLLPNRRLISFDMPGTGGSSTSWVPLPMTALARLATGVLSHLGIERADVLGVSWGGVLAQILAIHHPKSVGKLVLAATSCGQGSIPGSPSTLWIMATPRRYYSPAYLNRVAPNLYGGKARSEPETFRQQAAARHTRPPSILGYASQIFAIATTSTIPSARRIKSPTLILAGSDDPLVPSINSRMLHRLIPESTLCIVPDAGHMFLFDSATEVAPIIERFLRAGSSTSSIERGGETCSTPS